MVIKYILAFLLVASPVWAGSIQINMGGPPVVITTTASQDVLLQDFVDQFNLSYDPDGDSFICRADPDDTCLTIATYIEKEIIRAITGPALKQQSRRSAAKGCIGYKVLSIEDKQTINNLLGNRSPCSEDQPQ